MVFSVITIYMDNIKARKGYEEKLPELRPLIKEMMDRLKEPIVRKHFNLEDQRRYFDFSSPLRMIKDQREITINSRQYNEMLIEADFLNLYIDLNREEIRKLKKVGLKPIFVRMFIKLLEYASEV